MLLAGLAALLVIVAIGGPGHISSVLRPLLHGDVRLARLRLEGLGGWAACTVVALVLLHTVVPFPIELVAAAAGFALGIATALPILLVSLLASALVAYWVGLRLARPTAGRLFGADRVRALEGIAARGGARTLLVLRLFPLVPFSPIGVACGLARIPLRRFLWTTAVGILPELALVTYLGARLRSPDLSDPTLWGPLVGLLCLVLLAPPLLGRRRGNV